MSDNGTEWLRGRGIGRERLAGHIGEFLSSNGYKVDQTQTEEPAETSVVGELSKMNPAVPPSGKRLQLKLSPTSGGCAVYWVAPTAIVEGDRARLDRFVREMLQDVERSVLTGSHGAAKISKAPGAKLPWDPT